MRIYLDNNATTPLHPEVLRALEVNFRDVFGNASSIHQEGQNARRVIEDARESVGRLIGAAPRDIVFTSGGTESNNAAIFGAVSTAGRHQIVTTQIEHPSVAEPISELERRGHEVVRVAPSRSGRVDAARVIEALRPETRLVAMMLANNETGVLQPADEVARVCRERGIHFHCDAVQAVGKVDVSVDSLGCDTFSMSAHKMHAPKGIGALYVRRGIAMSTHLFGGAQERRRRPGTENVPLAAAFGVAARVAADGAWRAGAAALRDRLEREMARAAEITVNGADVPRLPNTSNITFRGIDGEGLVIALDLSGIAVSTGSACSSGRVEPSPILLAMGLTPEEAKSTVRVSLSRFTTAEEIGASVAVLAEVLPRCAVL
ncbi:MAG: cysteine desulfurase family protein [Thermoanaerobaculia bacterium]